MNKAFSYKTKPNSLKFLKFKYFSEFNDIKSALISKETITANIVDIKDEVAVWKHNNYPFKTSRLYTTNKDKKTMIVSFDSFFAYSLILDNQYGEIGEILKINYKQGEDFLIPFYTEDCYQGKIWNYKSLFQSSCKNLNNNERNLEVLKPTRIINPEEKCSPRFQINTGYIPIDYTNPIAEGSFCIYTGKSNTGKFDLMMVTMKNFIQNNKDSIVIYYSLSKQESNIIMKYFIKNDIQKDQFMIFCPENLASKADKLLTGLSSLKYAVEHRDRGKKVLFCMKDTFQYSVEVNE